MRPLLSQLLLYPKKEEAIMTKTKQWQLQPGVKIDDATAEEIAKIACALKSLSLYTTLVLEEEDCPEDLQQVVDEGVAAIGKIFAE
jgi:hypothetical protein